MRAFVRMFGLPSNWAIFGELHHTLRTGLPAAEKALPGGFWGYLAENAEAASIFNAAMSAKAQAHVPMIVAAYDFSPFGRIGDIGGGHGHLLSAVLAAAPKAQGVLFDLRPDAKLLLIEQIVPEDSGPHWTKLLDIHMMAYFAARQRTRQEYESLFRSAGFYYEREIETTSAISILEATVV
jgi:hypothetical protein